MHQNHVGVSERHFCNGVVWWKQELLTNCLQPMCWSTVQQRPKLLRARPELHLRMSSMLDHQFRPRFWSTKQLIAQHQRRRAEVRRRVTDHTEVEQSQLNEVLRDLPLDTIAAIQALHAVHEVRSGGHDNLEIQSAEHLTLHRKNIFFGVRAVGDVDKICDLGWVDLLKFRADEHRYNAHELKPLPHHWHSCQITVN